MGIYSAESPRVKLLKGRIEKVETVLLDRAGATSQEEEVPDSETVPDLPPILTIQLGEIDNRVALLDDQKISLEAQLDALNDSIARTPEVSIALDELNRK